MSISRLRNSRGEVSTPFSGQQKIGRDPSRRAYRCNLNRPSEPSWISLVEQELGPREKLMFATGDQGGIEERSETGENELLKTRSPVGRIAFATPCPGTVSRGHKQ
ncbi:hypothetical protein K0M31_007510 [Melipona bicolor]|uniref:Uncharacterized protein n=1 Tax=Melipona bicolor TaxID=60889 RepID=A0AA40KVV5_9HYME|nr:hypothetical protein K0M31_007510 [Melipona bicolor]